MAILTGFPPSNTINPTTFVPTIIPTETCIDSIPLFNKFKHNGSEFFLFKKEKGSCEAICYLAQESTSSSGTIYGFDKNLKVTYLREEYHK
jgi:hypothetical protein